MGLLDDLREDPVYVPVIGFAKRLFAMQGLRFTITGSEHIPTRGGAVLAINHIGYMDFTYAGLACLPSHRRVRFMAKEAVFRHKVSGPLMRGMKHIAVDRAAGSASIRDALRALKGGELIGVFPEATISRSFEIKEFKTGAVRMAAAAGVPIIPIVIWGSQRVWTKGHPKRLGRTNTPISVTVGEPMTVGKTDDPDEATQRLRERMIEMLHAAQVAYEPLTGDDRKFLPVRLGGTAPTLEEATALDRADAAARIAARERGDHAPPRRG